VGYADTEPLIPEDPYAVANRRISITVMKIAGVDNSAPGPGVDVREAMNVKTTSSQDSKTSLPLPSKTETNSPAGKSVSVGEPDTLPTNVRISKEPAPPPAAKRDQ